MNHNFEKLYYKKWIERMMLLSFLLIIFQCSPLNDKFTLPNVPETVAGPGLDNVEYILLKNLDAENGYNFNKPADIYIGADNFIYVADTENDRIVMLDAAGEIQGISQEIENPEAITQNDSLQLLVVNKTNTIFRLDLYKNNHVLANTQIEPVFEWASDPDIQFTGISVHNNFEYYVTVIDIADTAQVRNSSFIWDFNGNHTRKGPLPLFTEGSGLYTALIPTSIISLRERYLDISSFQEKTPAFLFTQKGKTSLYENFFKVQATTTTIVEGSIIIIPNTSFIGKAISDPNEIFWPEDIAIDRSGFIFVVDKGNSSHTASFYRFSTRGDILQKLSGDGNNADDITLNEPKGIAVLPDIEEQIVYLADTGNDRILMFKKSNDL